MTEEKNEQSLIKNIGYLTFPTLGVHNNPTQPYTSTKPSKFHEKITQNPTKAVPTVSGDLPPLNGFFAAVDSHTKLEPHEGAGTGTGYAREGATQMPRGTVCAADLGGIARHEAQHAVFSAVGQKHGYPTRLRLAKRMYGALEPIEQRALETIASRSGYFRQSYYNSKQRATVGAHPNYHEEAICSLQNYLTSPDWRESVHADLVAPHNDGAEPHNPDWSLDNKAEPKVVHSEAFQKKYGTPGPPFDERSLHNTAKIAWTKLSRLAPLISEEFLNERPGLIRKSEDGSPVKVASVGVFNDAGQMLWAVRNDSGKYTCPGGHFEKDETPLKAAVRELYEESGLKPKEMEFLGEETIQASDKPGKTITVYAFKAICDGTPTCENDPDGECDEWEWVDLEDGALPDRIIHNLHSPKHVVLKLLGMQKEELSKGALQARHPFSPGNDFNEGRAEVRDWQMGWREGREGLPAMPPNARFRALHKLHGITHVRRDPTGTQREFLLWRGHDSKDTVVSDNKVVTSKMSSWTPNKNIAKGFGGQVTGAWVPEDAIHLIPNALGRMSLVNMGTMSEMPGGENEMSPEYEVITTPHTATLHETAGGDALEKMALADLPVGQKLKQSAYYDDEDSYDYSHLLSEEHRKEGYGILLRAQRSDPDNPVYAPEVTAHLTHDGTTQEKTEGAFHGRVIGNYVGKGDTLHMDVARVAKLHRGKGLGRFLYEAVMAHAKNALGLKRVEGGGHSGMASKAHVALSAKHGMDYKPQPKERLPLDYKPEPFDGKFKPYSYDLKAEESMTKMALADIPIGHKAELGNRRVAGYEHLEAIPDYEEPQHYDYNHILPEDLKERGFHLMVTTLKNGEKQKKMIAQIHRPGENEPVGSVIGYHTPQTRASTVSYAQIEDEKLHGKGLGPLMYEALMAHSKNVLGAKWMEGDVHSSMASRVHEKLADKHSMDYWPEPNESEDDWDKPEDEAGPFDNKFGPYSYQLKAEEDMAKMAIADLKPGEELDKERFNDPWGGVSKVYDYSHHLPNEFSGRFRLSVKDFFHPSNPDLPSTTHATLKNQEGRYVGSAELRYRTGKMNEPYVVPHAQGIDDGMLYGKGLGKALYEAMYTHAFHKHGVRSIMGGVHTEEAERVHQSLARKHGFEYIKHPESTNSGLFPFGDYEYNLKDEVPMTKSVGFLTFPHFGVSAPHSEPMTLRPDQTDVVKRIDRSIGNAGDNEKRSGGIMAASSRGNGPLAGPKRTEAGFAIVQPEKEHLDSVHSVRDHEAQHSVFNWVAQKHGWKASQSIAKHLFEKALTPQQQSMAHSIARVYGYQRDEPFYHEEALASLQTFLISPKRRRAFYSRVDGADDPDKRKEFHSILKNGWRKLMTEAHALTPVHVGLDKAEVDMAKSEENGDVDRLLYSENPVDRKMGLKLDGVTEQHLHSMLHDDDMDVRLAALAHPNMTPGLLYSPLFDENPTLQEAALGHRCLNSAHLTDLVGHPNRRLRAIIATKDCLTGDQIRKMFFDKDNDIGIKLALLNRPAAPDDLLVEVAQEAQSSGQSDDLKLALEAITHDEFPETVLKAIAANESAPLPLRSAAVDALQTRGEDYD